MLLKTSGGVPHAGGVLTTPGEPYYEIIKAWIGCRRHPRPEDAARQVARDPPPARVIPLPGQKQQLAVIATYADGTVRDVSAEAFLDSSNTEVATVDRQGTVTAVRRGETTVMARYEGTYAATTLIVMGDRTGFAWKPVEPYNWIDKLVYEKLEQVKVLPSDVCTDSEFIRRIYLDLTGTVADAGADAGLPRGQDPEPAQAREAHRHAGHERRLRRTLDEQVGRPVAGQPQVPRRAWGGQVPRLDPQGGRRRTRPTTSSSTSILTGTGSNSTNPQASYYKVLRTADAVMENTTQLFLAVRFNCNKCHDHPFERWTQDNYYQLSALLRPGRPDRRPQVTRARRSAARPSRARCRSSRSSRTPRPARSRTSAPASCPGAVPLRAQGSRRRRGPAPRAGGEVDHVEGESALRQELRQPPLGATCSASG